MYVCVCMCVYVCVCVCVCRLVGVKARDLKAALVALYGPRTTVSLAVHGIAHAHELTLVPSSSGGLQWVCSKVFDTVKDGKLFAPGNLRGTQDNKGYHELVQVCLYRMCSLVECVLFAPGG